jgi:putative FmdB family regulatory protein
MPTYSYRGTQCDHQFDYVQKFADSALTECIECGGPVRRVYSPVGVVFKGSGWYINDSRKSATGNGSKDTATAAENGKADGSSPTDSANDKKTDGKDSATSTSSAKATAD